MSDAFGTADVMPSATPSDAEIAEWQALPRGEQLRRLRAVVTSSRTCTASPGGMDDVWAQIQARRNQAAHG